MTATDIEQLDVVVFLCGLDCYAIWKNQSDKT